MQNIVNNNIRLSSAVIKLTTAFACILLLLIFNPLKAQEVKVDAKLDRSTIRIGEQAKLQLTATYDKKSTITKLTWPALKDTIVGKVEIISQTPVQKSNTDSSSSVVESKTIIITCFDSGYYALPPFQILINGDSGKVAASEALMLHVQTLPVDTTKAIKDIKAIHEVPFAFEDVKWYVLIGFAVLLIAGIAYWLIRKNKIKPIVIIPKAPPVLPHVDALARLEKLRADKLWQNSQEKLYHSTISDILREYISKRFPVNAMELTTDEINLRFRKINISREFKDQLYQVLFTADMVKFAKERPLPGENEQCLEQAIQFIKNTMPIAQTPPKQPDIQAQDNG
jgi:hypothetical protein